MQGNLRFICRSDVHCTRLLKWLFYNRETCVYNYQTGLIKVRSFVKPVQEDILGHKKLNWHKKLDWQNKRNNRTNVLKGGFIES